MANASHPGATPTAPRSTASVDRLLHQRTIEDLGRTIPVATAVLAPFAIAFLFSDVAIGVLIWAASCAASMFALNRVRVELRRRDHERAPDAGAAERRRDERLLELVVAACALVWGSLTWWVAELGDAWLAVATGFVFVALGLISHSLAASWRACLWAAGPIIAMSASGLLSVGTSFAYAMTLILTIGGGYSVAMYAIVHTGQRRAALAEHQRSMMLGVLEAERRRLAKVNELLELEATTDPLTGLMNRAGLRQIVAGLRMLRVHTVGLVVIDLDGFKAVNDTYGHTAGDAVLVELARRWSSSLRADDALVRVGGDEFLLVAPGVPDDDVASRIAERLRAQVDDPIDVPGGTVRITCSIGSSVGPPERIEELVDVADGRLYATRRLEHDRHLVVLDEADAA